MIGAIWDTLWGAIGSGWDYIASGVATGVMWVIAPLMRWAWTFFYDWLGHLFTADSLLNKAQWLLGAITGALDSVLGGASGPIHAALVTAAVFVDSVQFKAIVYAAYQCIGMVCNPELVVGIFFTIVGLFFTCTLIRVANSILTHIWGSN